MLERGERSEVDTTTPVVLLQGVADALHHGMLAAARTLGRFGARVFTISNQPGNAAGRSKYVCGGAALDLRRAPPEHFLDAIHGLAGKGVAPLLIPVDDVATLYLEDLRADVGCIGPRRSPGLLRRLMDKRQLASVLLALDIPAPVSRVVSSSDELADAAETIGFPIVLKIADPLALRANRGVRSVTVLDTLDSLVGAYRRLNGARTSALLQEHIGGAEAGDWIFNGSFDANARCLFHGTGVKVHQWPLGTGAATRGVSVPNDVVRDLSFRLASAVGYTGMVDIDFRFDARDGSYKLLDVNPRLGSSFRLFVGEGGMDTPRAHYLDTTGQPVTPMESRPGRTWIVETRDLLSSFSRVRSARLPPPRWLSSLSGVEEMAWFDWQDPRPFASMLRHYAERLLTGRKSR